MSVRSGVLTENNIAKIIQTVKNKKASQLINAKSPDVTTGYGSAILPEKTPLLHLTKHKIV